MNTSILQAVVKKDPCDKVPFKEKPEGKFSAMWALLSVISCKINYPRTVAPNKKHLILHSFCGLELWEWLSQMILAQDFS